jgi:endonuclease G, mitochondrial
MKRNTFFIFITLLFLALFLWKYINPKVESSVTSVPSKISFNLHISSVEEGYPEEYKNDTILKYSGFHLSYNEEFEEPDWVAYILTRDDVIKGAEERTNNFRADTMIFTGSAIPSDYKNSGFDKGHLAPAGDMKWSPKAMSESFLMSNISPQVPGFNRGIWNKLEDKVRRWAIINDSLYIVTGPILNGVNDFIGINDVGVPHYFFKVIVDISAPSFKAIAFLMENKGSSRDVFDYAVTIDSIERFTGYNFFPGLPDKNGVENMESNFDISDW